ncbi:hypothetical protein J6590_002264, partial [Homalodisca vitripennis]
MLMRCSHICADKPRHGLCCKRLQSELVANTHTTRIGEGNNAYTNEGQTVFKENVVNTQSTLLLMRCSYISSSL